MVVTKIAADWALSKFKYVFGPACFTGCTGLCFFFYLELLVTRVGLLFIKMMDICKQNMQTKFWIFYLHLWLFFFQFLVVYLWLFKSVYNFSFKQLWIEKQNEKDFDRSVNWIIIRLAGSWLLLLFVSWFSSSLGSDSISFIRSQTWKLNCRSDEAVLNGTSHIRQKMELIEIIATANRFIIETPHWAVESRIARIKSSHSS